MTIRTKEIPPGSGNFYTYEQKSVRNGSKVETRHVRYIGKGGDASGAVVPKGAPFFNETSRDGATTYSHRDQDSQMDLVQRGNTITIVNVEVNENARGKGIGSKLYTEAFRTAKDQRAIIQSGTTVEDLAARRWMALQKAGEPVAINPKATKTKEGSWYVAGSNFKEPPFTADFRPVGKQEGA